MFIRIDHVMICVSDLEKGMVQYRGMGFNVFEGGVHPGKGTLNAIALNEEDYIELLAIHNPAELRTAAVGPGNWHAGLEPFIAAGGGIRYVILQSDDLAADVAAMRGRGVEVSDVTDGKRTTRAGMELRWKTATLGATNPLPIFFIQHMAPMAERRRITHYPLPITEVEHPNGARFLERAYIVVQDLEAAVAIYSKVLGVSEPRMYKGTVIMSHMAVFQFGAAGLTLAHPYAPGPAADHLERRGPGPFQVLVPHHQHGRGRALDAGARPAAPRARRARHRRARHARPAHRCLRSVYRVRRPGVAGAVTQ